MYEDDIRRGWDDDEGEFEDEPFLEPSIEGLRLPSKEELLGRATPEDSIPEMEEHKRFKPDREVEVKVMGVFEHAEPSAPVHTFVLLKDNKGRRVPILIGRFEALSISIALNDEQTERPLTHDLMKIMLDRLSIRIDRVVVDDLWRETFYAKIFLSRNGEEIEIDSRPSDAIALAVRYRAPIYMSESVVDTVVRSQEDG
jgi:hypothetical protein